VGKLDEGAELVLEEGVSEGEAADGLTKDVKACGAFSIGGEEGKHA
jgi:hypothetical protein